MVFICRHGQTEWNVERRLQGSGDSPLTELGKNQAIAMGKRLKQVGSIERIISTPLGRGLSTAELIADILEIQHEAIIIDNRIQEKSFGCHEGLTREEREEKYLSQLQARRNNQRNYSFPGGESDAEVAIRVRDFIDSFSLGSRDVIVTHSATQRILMGILGNLSERDEYGIRARHNIIHRWEEGTFLHSDIDNDTNTWVFGIDSYL